MTDTAQKRILHCGRLFFAAGIVAIGLQHIYNADFIPVIVPFFPSWMRARGYWTCVSGLGLAITGGAIIIGKAARQAAIILGCAFVALLVCLHIPAQLRADPAVLAAWTNSFKILTLAGGAFAVAASLPSAGTASTDRRFTMFGCLALAATCAVFGIDHFLYTGFVASLVPDWLSHHVFWTYFCGAALFAGGAGMILGIRGRLAAGLLGTMIFIWLIVLHIPRAIADPHSGNGNEWTSVFEALAFSGIAFILSRTLPKKA